MRSRVAAMIVATVVASSPAFAQFVQQGSKLVGTGAIGNASQGAGVALSADGHTAIVGGPQDNGAVGAAWIFVRSGATWAQQGSKLVASDAIGAAFFGGNVALSADGNTAIVGGGGDNGNVGAAWIFVRSGTTWSQQGSKLVGSDASAGAHQGAVAISADGNTAVVGGPTDTFYRGAIWIFVRNGVTWSQQGPKLVGTNTFSGFPGGTVHGGSVAISADGNTALAGGINFNGNEGGAAWVYTRQGSTWTQQGNPLTVAGAPVAHGFGGEAVALSADGNTAAIGSQFNDSSDGFTRGGVHVFTRSGSTWTQQGSRLAGTPVSGNTASQGRSVSLSSDGNVLFEGGYGDDNNAGASWAFVRRGTTWSQVGGKLVGSGAVNGTNGAVQGNASALSSDGRTAIVGGYRDNELVGAAWIFTWSNDVRRASDTDRDGQSDITVYNTSSGVWSLLTSASGYTGGTSIGWGGSGYTPVPGDYDSDGKTDLGVYHAASGNWYVLLSGANFTTMLSKNAGGPGWIPVPGDYDGDGQTDIVVYNTSSGQWYGLKSGSSYSTTLNINWGGSGYQAVQGDFDGDGRADIAVYQITSGNWYVLPSSSNYTTSLWFSVGGSGWTPVPADFDGDGRTDVIVYNTTSGQWYGLKSGSGYTTTLNMSWGGTGYLPVRGDFDGDGCADLATYVESTGMWYVLLSGANYTTALARSWGGPGSAAMPPFP